MPAKLKAWELIAVLAVIGFYVAAQKPLLRRPFVVGHDGYNGAFFSTSARNTLRFGFLATRLAPSPSHLGNEPPRPGDFYTSHPYGYPLLLSLVYRSTGVGEAAGRSLSLAFSAALILVVFLFCRLHGGLAAGLAGAGTLASIPIMHHFGPMILAEIPSLVFVAALYLGHFAASPTASHRVIVFLSVLLGGLLDWNVYVHAAALGAYTLLRGEGNLRARLPRFLPIFLAALSALGLFLLHTAWLGGLHYLFLKLGERTGMQPAVHYTWASFLHSQWRWVSLMYSRPILILALLGLILPGGKGAVERAGRIAALAALVEALLLTEAFYIHIYFTFVWILPVCFGIASLVARLPKKPYSLLVIPLAALLLVPLFTRSARGARAAFATNARRSLPLLALARKLGPQIGSGEIVLLHTRLLQFGPQLSFYLGHPFRYTGSGRAAVVQARRCSHCRFMVIARKDYSLPDSTSLARTLGAEYEHWSVGGFEVIDLGRRRPDRQAHRAPGDSQAANPARTSPP